MNIIGRSSDQDIIPNIEDLESFLGCFLPPAEQLQPFSYQEPDGVMHDLDASRGGLVQEPAVDDTPPSSQDITTQKPLQQTTSGSLGSLGGNSDVSSYNTTSSDQDFWLGSDNGSYPSASVDSPALGLSGQPLITIGDPAHGLSGQPLITIADVTRARPFHVAERSSATGIPTEARSPPVTTGSPGVVSVCRGNPVNESVKERLTNKLRYKAACSPPSPQPMKTLADSAEKTKPLRTGSRAKSEQNEEEKARLQQKREEARREKGRIHAATTRKRKKDKMEELETKVEEQEAIQEIYKKCISIFYRQLKGVYPDFTPRSMNWYRTSDVKEEPIRVTCLIPNTDPQFLHELGNNPGGGFLNYHRPDQTDQSVKPAGQPAMTNGTSQSPRAMSPSLDQSPEGNLPKLEDLNPTGKPAPFAPISEQHSPSGQTSVSNIFHSAPISVPVSTNESAHPTMSSSPSKAQTSVIRAEDVPSNSASCPPRVTVSATDGGIVIGIDGKELRIPSARFVVASAPNVSEIPEFVLSKPNPSSAQLATVCHTNQVSAALPCRYTVGSSSVAHPSGITLLQGTQDPGTFRATATGEGWGAALGGSMFEGLDADVLAGLMDTGELSNFNLSSLDFKAEGETEMEVAT